MQMSKKKQAAYKVEDAALAADVEKALTRFEEKFTAAENEKDAARKILSLMNLNQDLANTQYSITRKFDDIAENRGKHSGKTVLKRTGLTLASLTLIALPFTTVLPTWHSKKSVAENLQALRENAGMDNFENAVVGYQTRVAELLDQTIKGCDLREISKSPHFPDALDRNGALKRKFDAAAAARAALGDEPAPAAAAPEKSNLTAAGSQPYPQIKL
jgi:hypothetical protein